MTGPADLIERAYAAAIDPHDWSAWTTDAGRWLDAHTTAVSVVDRHDRTLVWTDIHHPEPEALEEYFSAGIWRDDPQIAPVTAVARRRLFRSADVLDLSDPATRHYVAFTSDRGGIGQFATAASAMPGGRYVGTLTIHRAVGDGAVEATQARRLSALARGLEGALRLAIQHGEKLVAQYWDGQLARAIEPCALLAEDGRLLRATASLERLLRAADGLDASGGRLRARDPASEARLARAIGRAASGEGAAGARIARVSGRAPYVVTAWPVARARRDMVVDEAAVLLTVVDPVALPRLPVALWRDVFALTVREAELAQALMAGHSPESAAAMLEVSLATVRVHLRRLLAKTGTARQADLVRLLARVA